jgi:hypothetical protein
MLLPALLALALFGVNAYICRELFGIEHIGNLDSNEGAFVAISRFFRENPFGQRWFTFFDAGMPLENAYQPLLPFTAAAVGWLTHWSVGRAFHFVLAMAYCLGPVTLFWFAWDWSRSLTVATTAGLAYSLTSFGELLIPILRVPREGGPWMPLRLFNLIHYAEDPHIVALTLVPLALLFLRRAMAKRTALNVVGAVVFCAGVVATNAFGAVDLAVAGVCIALALRGGWLALGVIGLAAYCWMCPWLPPSLIALIARDQWSARGAGIAGIGFAFSVCALLVWLTRRLPPFERFCILFAPWMCLFPMSHFLLNTSIIPQGNRYQLEMEMALCLALGCLVARLASRRMVGIALVAVLSFVGVRQAKIYRHAARGLIQPIDITQTTEYKLTRWLDRNLPGQRAMVSGDAQFLYNVYSNNPQLGGGHEPQVPNWMNRVALYVVYAESSAEASVFWLKAFGVQAVNAPGGMSFVYPHKFDGVLPALWHEGGETVFGVPQRSKSLAHVIPASAVVIKKPVHGLDLNPARAYVAALDDPSLALAEMTWSGSSAYRVRAPMQRGQVISVQVTHMPGWEATVNGHAIPVRSDQLGLTVLEPGCEGNCEIEVRYGVTAESWACRALSALVTLGLALCSIGYLGKNSGNVGSGNTGREGRSREGVTG